LRSARPGARFTLAQLLELMLSASDNAAADLLIGRVGVPALQEEVRHRGLHFGPFLSLLQERQRIYGALDPRGRSLSPARVRELGTFDSLDERARQFSRMLNQAPPWTGAQLAGAFEQFYREGWNSAPIRQMGDLLEQVARCEDLSPASCARLQDLMHRCWTGARRIRAGLPKSAWWAHKTGTQYRRACDSGLLELGPAHWVVIAACARDFESVPQADAVFARIGRAAWDAFKETGGAGSTAPPAPSASTRQPPR
jgi:beta-lactamase class A